MKPPVRYERGILRDSEGKDIGVAELVCAFNHTWKHRPSEAEQSVVLATEKGLTTTGQKIAADERDAERYRWLRQRGVDCPALADDHLFRPGKILDAAIDAAMSVRSDTPGGLKVENCKFYKDESMGIVLKPNPPTDTEERK